MNTNETYISLLKATNQLDHLSDVQVELAKGILNDTANSPIIRYATAIIYLDQMTKQLETSYRKQPIRLIKKLLEDSESYAKLVTVPSELYNQLAISAHKFHNLELATEYQSKYYKLSNSNEVAFNLLLHSINSNNLDIAANIFKRVNFLTLSYNTKHGNELVDIDERNQLRDLIDIYLKPQADSIEYLIDLFINLNPNYIIIDKFIILSLITRLKPNHPMLADLVICSEFTELGMYIKTSRSKIVRTIPVPIFKLDKFSYDSPIIGSSHNKYRITTNQQALNRQLSKEKDVK